MFAFLLPQELCVREEKMCAFDCQGIRRGIVDREGAQEQGREEVMGARSVSTLQYSLYIFLHSFKLLQVFSMHRLCERQ